MTTISQSVLTKLDDRSKWNFLFSPFKYSVVDALVDLTGIGAIFNLGCEYANLQKNQRMNSWLQGISEQRSSLDPSTVRFVDEICSYLDDEQSAIHTSILTKIGYVASLGIALFTQNYLQKAAVISAIGLGAYFMCKAGFNTVDQSKELREREILIMKEQCLNRQPEVCHG